MTIDRESNTTHNAPLGSDPRGAGEETPTGEISREAQASEDWRALAHRVAKLEAQQATGFGALVAALVAVGALVMPSLLSPGSIRPPIVWVVGLLAVTLGGHVITTWISGYLHAYRQKVSGPLGWLAVSEADNESIPLLPMLIGGTERAVFFVLAAVGVSGLGAAMGGWFIAKMATSWVAVLHGVAPSPDRPGYLREENSSRARLKSGPAYRMLALTALLNTLVSVALGVVGGLLARAWLPS